MRIAVFVPSFPELSETFILRQVTGLIDRGHEVGIFAYRQASGGPAHAPVDAYGLRRLVRVLPHRDDPRDAAAPAPSGERASPLTAVARLAASGIPRRADTRAMGGWRAFGRTLAALAAERPFDVVHCHYGDIGLRYAAAARLWRAPLVVSFYGHDASAIPRSRGPRVYEPLFARAAAVTSLSGHMDSRLRALGCPDACLTRVPLSVDGAEFRAPPREAGTPGTPVRLLTVARLTEKKGIAYALHALALVADEFPEVRHDIIGDGPLRGELELLAATLGLADRVRFLGAQAGEDVRAAFDTADLFVLPSVTAADGDEEGTPTVLLEAAFAGIPVLSTHHAGIPDLVVDGKSGLLVPERDAAALAAALRRLLRAPEQWDPMGEAARRHVEHHHTVEAVAERLERLYVAVRDRGSPRASGDGA